MKSIGTLLAIARRNFLAMLCWALLGGAAAGAITFTLPVEYQATARVMIVAPYWNDSTAIADPNISGAVLAYGDEFTQQRLASYARLVETPFITGPVSERLGLGISAGDLSRKVTTHVIPDTVIVEVEALDGSPTRAALIADETAEQLVGAVKEVERPPFTRVSPVQPLLVESASVPDRPVSPRTILIIGSGLLLGFLTGLTYVAMREGRAIAELVGSAGDAEDVLGILSADESRADVVDRDAGLVGLQIERLRGDASAPLVFAAPRGTPAVTLAARQLAATKSADRDRHPIVVVADPSVVAGAAGRPGLLDVAANRSALDDAIMFDDVGGFDWLPFGGSSEPEVRPPCDVLNGVINLLAATREVIVIAPAVLESVDAVDLTGSGTVSVLVTEAPGTSNSDVQEAERLLRLGRGRYLGRVIVAAPALAHNALADRL